MCARSNQTINLLHRRHGASKATCNRTAYQGCNATNLQQHSKPRATGLSNTNKLGPWRQMGSSKGQWQPAPMHSWVTSWLVRMSHALPASPANLGTNQFCRAGEALADVRPCIRCHGCKNSNLSLHPSIPYSWCSTTRSWHGNGEVFCRALRRDLQMGPTQSLPHLVDIDSLLFSTQTNCLSRNGEEILDFLECVAKWKGLASHPSLEP